MRTLFLICAACLLAPLAHAARFHCAKKPFRIPSGLTGGLSAVFFLPDGVKFPEGSVGGTMLYDMHDLTCHGNLCGIPCPNCSD